MSPDWASKPEAVPYSSLGDPQSLNLYSYVGNNPLSKADADGHCWPVCTTWFWQGVDVLQRAGSAFNKAVGSFISQGAAVISDPTGRSQAVMAMGMLANSVVPVPEFGGGTTVTETIAPLETESISTTTVLTGLANDAVQNVGHGNGAVYGTAVHSEFSDLVEATGNSNLSTEVSYKGGQVVPYGTSGSVRADVVEGPVNAPTQIYDLKTGKATLTSTRVNQIQNNIPGGSNVPVTQIKPQP